MADRRVQSENFNIRMTQSEGVVEDTHQRNRIQTRTTHHHRFPRGLHGLADVNNAENAISSLSDEFATQLNEEEKKNVLKLDTEEAFLRGYIPLDKLKVTINTQIQNGLEEIDFSGNGYCTDIVLKILVESLKEKDWDKIIKIKMIGCFLLTDVGISYLTNITSACIRLSEIDVSGCENITNAGVVALTTRWSHVIVKAIGTSVTHSFTNVICGKSNFGAPGAGSQKEFTALTIIPHKDVKYSLGHILKNGTKSIRKMYESVTVPLDPWKFITTEMTLNMNMFENILPYFPSQVILPFNLDTDIADIKNHVSQSIVRVLSKECLNTKIKKKENVCSAANRILHCNRLHLEGDGVISLCNNNTNNADGGLYSVATPFSRTNTKFEVECLTADKDATLMFGISCDSVQQPSPVMDFDGLLFSGLSLNVGKIYSLEITSSWSSEFDQTDLTAVMFECNGKAEQITMKDLNPLGLYPSIKVLGTSAKLKILNFGKYMKCPNQLVDVGFLTNASCDENGVLTKWNSNGRALMSSNVSVGNHNCTVTIKLLNVGCKSNITLGIGPEKYPRNDAPGWRTSSVAHHGDDGYLYHKRGSGSDFGEIWKTGDEIRIVVSNFGSDYVQTGDTLAVEWFKNNQKVGTTVNFTYDSPEKCVFLIGMHAVSQRVQIINFHRSQQTVTCNLDKLTFGRCTNATLADDGTLTYSGEGDYAKFISKTPFSKHLPYFEMTVVGKEDAHGHISIGMGPEIQPYNRMIGWDKNTLALHADNGKIYQESGSGLSHKQYNIFEEKDVVGCGINISEAKFDDGGFLIPRQMLYFYFTINGKKVVENLKMFYETDGVYPSVACHFPGDVVLLHNYTSSLIAAQMDKVQLLQDGCHFVAVGIGKEDNKKYSEIQQSLQLKKLLKSSSELLDLSLQDLQRNTDKLNKEEQERYSVHLWQRQCYDSLIKSSYRLNFMTVDLESEDPKAKTVDNDSIRKLKATIIKHENEYSLLHTDQYIYDQAVRSYIVSVVNSVRNHGVKTFNGPGSVQNKCHNKSIGQLISQQVICFEGVMETVLANPNSWSTYLKNLTKPNTEVGLQATCVGAKTLTWTKELVTKHCNNKSKNDVFDEILPALGLLRIPCLRMTETDKHFLYTFPDFIISDEDKMAEFISTKDTKDMLTISRSYSFPFSVPVSLFICSYNLACKYSRVLLLTKSAAVFQSGAVQTVMHEENDDSFRLQSQCYCPTTSVLTEAVPDVTENTLNVFFLFCDFVDNVIKGLKLIPIVIKENIPPGFVNNSIGCEHNWNTSKLEITVCTLCNQCCNLGRECQSSGIISNVPYKCGCQTTIAGCDDCGICQKCADELWTLKSRLRPCCDVTLTENDMGHHSMYPLNGQTYNEFTCIALKTNTPICLKQKNDSSEHMIQVYPGPPVEFDTLSDFTKYNSSGSYNNIQFQPGDYLKIRLKALQKVETPDDNGIFVEKSLEIKHVYYTVIDNEVKIWHDTGILCYETMSKSGPVGQFIGPKPLSPECNKFSIKVLNDGRKRFIAIGLCHKRYRQDRQPGWDLGSCGYHADDGGMFSGAGFPKLRLEKYHKGDIIACEYDFSENKYKFYKNSELVHVSETMKIPAGGFFPAVGFHSHGECVQLLEKEPWELPSGETPTYTPKSFDAYKYGNIWICPGQILSVINSRSGKYGWLMFHNRSRGSIAYVISSETDVFGTLASRENFTECIKFDTVPTFVDVEWFTIDSSQQYTKSDIQLEFEKRKGEVNSFHRLKTKEIGVAATTKLGLAYRALTRVTERKSNNSEGYSMEVIVNEKSLTTYWLKHGNYHAYRPKINPDNQATCIILNPKFPTFDNPNNFQRGMSVIADFKETGEIYTECIINEVKNGGQILVLEYTDSVKKEQIIQQVTTNSKIIQLENVKIDITTINTGDYQLGEQHKDEVDNAPPEKIVTQEQLVSNVQGFDASTGSLSLKKRGFIPVPLFLVTKDSRKVLELGLDSRWKENALISKSACMHIPTRITVQGKQLIESLQPDDTFDDEQVISSFGATVCAIFLPSNLNQIHLCMPSASKMFSDVKMHLLCSSVFRMRESQFQSHLMDMEPIQLETPLTVEEKYANMAVRIAYSKMLSRKVILSSYEKFFDGGKPENLSVEQIEALLYGLLKVYCFLCLIYMEVDGDRYRFPSNEHKKKILDNAGKSVSTSKDHNTQSESLVRQSSDNLLCNAHLLCIQRPFQDLETVMDLNQYNPYHRTVNIFTHEDMMITKMPAEFFNKFSNLQILSLSKCRLLIEIPEGLASCLQLKILELNYLAAMKSLPSDIFMSASLEIVQVNNVFVETLPTNFLDKSNLKALSLNAIGLTTIPDAICNLAKLEILELNHNPLSSLPVSVGRINNLKSLNLDAMPLLEFESGIQENDLMEWFNSTAYCYQQYLGDKIVGELFKKFDENNSGTLDVNEVAHLNNYLFWEVPRLGSNNLNDEEYGGISPAIFMLTSLEHLSLKNQSITSVPAHMCRLSNLFELDLAKQPLLESLPGALGHLPNIKSINLFRCPSLRTPPNEVVQRGFESVQAYLKRLAGGFTECRRTKLMLVGLGGAGKTSLLKAIMSGSNKTDGTKGEEITDGIEIQPWTIKNKDGVEVTYSTWDFAGQTLYYNTHQFFLSKRAIYLLVWSTRQGFEHAGLDFWLSSISCHAPKTPIFVVGTHCDQVPKADIAMNQLKKLYPQISGFYFVSSIEGTNIKELKDDMLQITLEQKNMGEKIPQVWLNLERKILKARTNTSILEWSLIKNYGMEEGIYDEKDIKEAVQFLHELGTVQYFDNDVLRDNVVINPQWIVNVMACVVSVKNSPIQKKKGKFYHSDVATIWKEYPKSLHKWLLQLTEQFDLTFPLPEQDVNIVPCLLPHEEPKQAIETLWPTNEELKKKGRQQSKMVYKFSYLPAGLFNRCQVRLFQFSNGKTIWKRGSMLKKNNHIALIRQMNESELEIQVCGPRPANIIFLVHEIIEGLIEESFNGVIYDFLVPCPDCISKEGTLDPCLFESDLVVKAKDHKAPFLQCRKYFHTISMAQLEEIIPSEGKTDFDAHLQRSIIMMQELNTDMLNDVTILYSAMDMPGPHEMGDKINPAWIKEELEKAGHSCWFSSDMMKVGVNELTLALKNCKVVVALVSDNFERDEARCDLLLYTIDCLTKQYIIAPIGNSMAWWQSNLGMRIGKQEQMIMLKNKSCYAKKIVELLKAVKDKIGGIAKNELIHYPECFLSYCWSNSHDAISKGSKKHNGALGHYDPRNIKKYLADKGINVWIDHEQATVNKGLYDNISKGLRNSKVVVACVSDEYVASDNCMMELRFAVLTLNLPLVIAVVGTGKQWKFSEVGILQQRSNSSKVYFQQENDLALDTLVTFINQRLPNAAEKLISEAKKVKDNVTEIHQQAAKKSTSNISYQEERELIQRKFMRHIISFMSRSDQTPMPRLILIDLEKTSKNTKPGRLESSLKKFGSRPKSATRSKEVMQVISNSGYVDIDDIWDEEGLCIKMLCEYEEGWHLCKNSLSFKRSESSRDKLKKVSPYLGRLYALAKQSHLNLNCLAGENGQNFINWIEQESKEHVEFLQGFQTLRSLLLDDDSDESTDFLDQLVRCHLPSGKIYWLCEEHQKMPRITKLTSGGGALEIFKNLYQEDVLLKEYMELSEIYKKKKAQKSTVTKINLPEISESEYMTKKPYNELDPNVRSASKKITEIVNGDGQTQQKESKNIEDGSKNKSVKYQKYQSNKKLSAPTEVVESAKNESKDEEQQKSEKSKACSIQ